MVCYLLFYLHLFFYKFPHIQGSRATQEGGLLLKWSQLMKYDMSERGDGTK